MLSESLPEDGWVNWPEYPVIWGEYCLWDTTLAGLAIPAFLIISQADRAKAWVEYDKTHGAAISQAQVEYNRSADLRAQAKKERDRVRIEKIKVGLERKEERERIQRELHAGKRWDARRARWVRDDDARGKSKSQGA